MDAWMHVRKYVCPYPLEHTSYQTRSNPCTHARGIKKHELNPASLATPRKRALVCASVGLQQDCGMGTPAVPGRGPQCVPPGATAPRESTAWCAWWVG